MVLQAETLKDTGSTTVSMSIQPRGGYRSDRVYETLRSGVRHRT